MSAKASKRTVWRQGSETAEVIMGARIKIEKGLASPPVKPNNAESWAMSKPKMFLAEESPSLRLTGNQFRSQRLSAPEAARHAQAGAIGIRSPSAK